MSRVQQSAADGNATHDVDTELEVLRNALLDWEIVIDEDRRAVGVALAKLEGSVAVWDRVAQRLAELVAQHDGGAAS
jgi:hypothetical protein